MRKILLFTGILFLSLSLNACATKSTGGGIGELQFQFQEKDITDAQRGSLGSVRVTTRQYASRDVVGSVNRARASNIKQVLVNESHKDYDKGSNEKLRKDEYFLSDSVMLQLFHALRRHGFFDPQVSNVRRVPKNTTIESYARSHSSIFKWICVEYLGEAYFIKRTSAVRQDKYAQAFNTYERIILSASYLKRLKATVGEVSKEDLRARDRELDRRRNATNGR